MSNLPSDISKLHFKFLPGEQVEYILRVRTASGLLGPKLAELVGTASRTFSDWARGVYSMSAAAGIMFSEKFGVDLPEEPEILIRRWKESKSRAGRVGGYACFRIHGSPGTVEGRAKGGREALQVMRERNIIPKAKSFNRPVFDEDLAEWVGIVLGDGGITHYQVMISLNRTEDRDYVSFVKGLGRDLFGDEPTVSHRGNCTVVCHTGVKLVGHLVEEVGLKVGNKVRQQVAVPDWISENRELSLACTRGLVDTDGGVMIHTTKVNGKKYPYERIIFSNRSVPLARFVHRTLARFGLTPTYYEKLETKRVWLYNKGQIDTYFNVFKTNNSRLLKFRSE